MQSDLDRITFKNTCNEEEKQKLMLKLEKKQSEIANVMLQRSEMETILKDK